MLPHIRPDMRIMSYSYDADVTHPCGIPAAAGGLVEYADTFLTWLNTERHATEAVCEIETGRFASWTTNS